MTSSDVYFALFLNQLRKERASIQLSDHACAALIVSALDAVSPDDELAADTAGEISAALFVMVEDGVLPSDNGHNPD